MVERLVERLRAARPFMLFGPVMMLLFVAACAAVVYLVMRSSQAHGGHAMEILGARSTRGDIHEADPGAGGGAAGGEVERFRFRPKARGPSLEDRGPTHSQKT